MPTVAFSLTERCLVNPILMLRAPPLPLEEGYVPGAIAVGAAALWYGIQSEVIARVVAVFASVFAAADVCVHLSSGLYKGASLLGRKLCCLEASSYSSSVVRAHFRQAMKFAGLTVIGSIAGVIWPGIFKSYRYSPPPPPRPYPLTPLPPHIERLCSSLETQEEKASLEHLKQVWSKSSLDDKRWIVQVYTADNDQRAVRLRKELAPIVYQPLSAREVTWLSEEDIEKEGRVEGKVNRHRHAFFYHATSEAALESILKTGRVEVRHEKAFRGAFVSTYPETGFGRCVLGFNRQIERLAPLEHGFRIDQNTYWAGFSQDIPVADPTLEYIMLEGGDLQACQDLKARCQAWAGRKIEVISLDDRAQTRLQAIRNLNMGIPQEWPDEGEAKGRMILHTLKVRATEAIQQAIPQALSSVPVSIAASSPPVARERTQLRGQGQRLLRAE